MRLNWNINARARVRSTKVGKGNAAFWFSPWLDVLELINRATMCSMGLFQYNNQKRCNYSNN